MRVAPPKHCTHTERDFVGIERADDPVVRTAFERRVETRRLPDGREHDDGNGSSRTKPSHELRRSHALHDGVEQ
jgi:hypothetical protein